MSTICARRDVQPSIRDRRLADVAMKTEFKAAPPFTLSQVDLVGRRRDQHGVAAGITRLIIRFVFSFFLVLNTVYAAVEALPPSPSPRPAPLLPGPRQRRRWKGAVALLSSPSGGRLSTVQVSSIPLPLRHQSIFLSLTQHREHHAQQMPRYADDRLFLRTRVATRAFEQPMPSMEAV